jgi:hypothetical protein
MLLTTVLVICYKYKTWTKQSDQVVSKVGLVYESKSLRKPGGRLDKRILGVKIYH